MNDIAPHRASCQGGNDAHRMYSFVCRYALLIITCAAVGGGLGVAYAKLATPAYTARAQLLLSPRPVAALQTSDVIVTFDAPYVDSQIAVLQSGALAELVLKALDLYKDPEFQPSAGEDARPSIEGSEEALVIKEFQKRLSIRRDGMSYAINIAFSSRDPVKAAKIANDVADAYIRDQVAARSLQMQQRHLWLENRIQAVRLELNGANRAIQAFKARGDYRIPPTTTPGESSLDELEARVSTYRKLIESYLYAQAETSQQESLAVANTRIITRALTPVESNIKMRWLLIIAAMAGGILGVALAVIRDLVRSTRDPTAEEDRIATTNVPGDRAFRIHPIRSSLDI
ncbi:MAG: Wzz/FepE/Etk N-terminal domain-containing protein [Hyphomicrobiaceae bacterium]